MISKSQFILLEALKASLFGVNPNYPDDVNWDEVVFEAKTQAIIGLVSPVIPVCDASVEQCKATYMRIMYEQDRLIKLFDSDGIPFVVLKGSAAAIYYPHPYLRSMGDIDVLVPRSAYSLASELLHDNGYVFIHENYRHVVFSKNGVEIELHHRFSSSGYDIDDVLESAIARRKEYTLTGYKFPILPNIENGLVLLGHINQHLKENSLGLRQIIDWMMYLHSAYKVDSWQREFFNLLQNAGLQTLAAYITQMCNDYLGLPESFDICDGLDNNLSEELLGILLTDGNCGRRLVSEGGSDERRVRSAIYKINRIGFFKYFTDVGLSAWSIGKDCPLLKPIAFLYGLVRQLFEGIKVLYKNKSIGKQVNEGKKRYKLYKKLGVRTGDKI